MLRRTLLAALVLTMSAFTATAADRVYEMRTYHTFPGKLDDLLKRFRDHTTRLFEKHGMTNVGYWIPKDQPNTLIYILSHKDQDTGMASWAAFQKDEAWVKARTASEANGKIVEKVDRVWMSPTDFSKLK